MWYWFWRSEMWDTEETMQSPQRPGTVWHGQSSCREMPRGILMTTMARELQSWPPHTGEARAMGHLLWRDEDVDCCWPTPKRDALLTSVMRLKKKMGLSKAFRAQVILCSPDCRHRASGFGICPAGFCFCFGIYCLMPLFSSFGESMFTLYPCKLEVYTLWLGSHSLLSAS